MSDRPYVLVAAMIGLLALAIAAAWYFGTAQRSPISATTATETFRAAPGTQRENARALISSREHSADKAGSRVGPVEVWGRLGAEGSTETERSAAESLRLADEVIADLDVERGLAVLEVELGRSGSPSALYAAMATLHARSHPYDSERVEDAFALALSTARTPEERVNALYRQSQVYMERGEHGSLLQLLERTKPEVAQFNLRSAEIELIRANALWSTNNAPAAVQTLESLLDNNEFHDKLAQPGFENVFRLAAARLIRMYREMGDESKADAVSRKLRSKLRG